MIGELFTWKEQFSCRVDIYLSALTSRSRVDGNGSVFGVAVFMSAPVVVVYLKIKGSWLFGFRSVLVLIFVFQAAFRNSNFNHSIGSAALASGTARDTARDTASAERPISHSAMRQSDQPLRYS
jgi:hypothetical protein